MRERRALSRNMAVWNFFYMENVIASEVLVSEMMDIK
jgi:hypothetical protein